MSAPILPAREQAPDSAPVTEQPDAQPDVTEPGHLSHLTDIEKAAYCQAVAEALALLNAEAL